MTKRDEYRIASLIETAIDHLDRAVDARVAEVGINALKAGVAVGLQATAAGMTPEQAEYLQRELAEVRLVFECRGWA